MKGPPKRVGLTGLQTLICHSAKDEQTREEA
jgi:hypothetical protein